MAIEHSFSAKPDLVAPRGALDYFASQSVTLARKVSPSTAWALIMARPLPLLAWAFRVRDAISARFGVARIGGFSGAPVGAPALQPRVGDHLDFFLVERADPDALTLTAHDRHLDVMIAVTTLENVLTITASVVTHNRFGRIYMVPVGPAHRLIVWAMLRRLQKVVADQEVADIAG